MWSRGDISEVGFETILKAQPIFERARYNWLAHAEVSLRPSSNKIGLSWFFVDPHEFNAFVREFGVPSALVDLANRLYSRFDLVPRLWVKMHLSGAQVEGFSQYFVIDSSIDYPISTIRLALKAVGLMDASRLEPAFCSVIGQPNSLWAVIAKMNGNMIHPRLSCYIERESFPKLFPDLITTSYLTSERAKDILEFDAQIKAGSRAYFSLDLNSVDAYSVDYSDLQAVPSGVEELLGSEPGRRYLKVRLGAQPEYTVYRSFPDVAHIQPERLTTIEVAKLYDQLNPAIQATYGTTYQAGDTAEGDFLGQVASRAEIESGQLVIDAGCGSGGPAVALAASVPEISIVGLTISKEQAATANNYIDTCGLARTISVMQGDYHHLPVGNEVADRVLFLESMSYGEMDVVLREAFRVLRLGGKVYIKEPFVKSEILTSQEAYELAEFDRVYGQQTPSIASVESCLASIGFEIERSESFGSEMNAASFTQRLFGPSGLNELGEQIYRAYQCLPVDFYEILAVKQG